MAVTIIHLLLHYSHTMSPWCKAVVDAGNRAIRFSGGIKDAQSK